MAHSGQTKAVENIQNIQNINIVKTEVQESRTEARWVRLLTCSWL